MRLIILIIIFITSYSLAKAQCAGTTIESEDFSSQPSGWTYGTGWQNGVSTSGTYDIEGDLSSTSSNGNYAYINDGNDIASYPNQTISSPSYDVSSYSTVTLSFRYIHRMYGGSSFTVEVYDGSSWVSIGSYDNGVDWENITVDVSAYINASFQVRFTYDDNGDWCYYAALDDFELCGTTSGGSSGACGSGYTELLNEDFESGTFPPTDWTSIQNGDPAGWTSSTTQSHSSSHAAFHNDNNVTSGCDDYLMSDILDLTTATDIQLTFWSYVNYSSSAETHEVVVSTDLSSFTSVYSTITSEDTWDEVNIDLSAYAGSQIYIGFHYTGDFAAEWYVDDVVVCANSSSAPTDCDSYDGSFDVSTIGYHTESGYSHDYILVSESSNLILEINSTGSFSGLSVGSYYIYAANYEDPAPGVLSVGSDWADVETYAATTSNCFDLSSSYRGKALNVCTEDDVCEPDDIVVSSENYTSDAGYSQTYVLVSSGNILSSNTSGVFTSAEYGSAGTFQIYAVNTEDTDVTNELADDGLWQDIPDLETSGSCVKILGPRNIDVVSVSLSPCTTLPVELTDFTAICENNSILFNWLTINEINNNYFTLEKSMDGKLWMHEKTVFSTANKSGEYSHKLEDDTDYLYFRLSQTDFDGKTKILKSIYNECISNNQVQISNVFFNEGILEAQLNYVDDTEYTFTITDMRGKQVKQETIQYSDKINSIKIVTGNLPSGIYNLFVFSDYGNHSKQFYIGN
ncbi:MAG: hypothetical protein C0594_16760 [Marinilabiliales bacterium]|nr:MAG: hypothetical protein C0594_16760 [Marinilabiliales bacterium]